jgi:tetrahydromethanopterin S-methyltransferase subunit B
VNAQVQSQLNVATANIPAQVANSAAAAASVRIQSQQSAAAAAQASAQAHAASVQAQAAADAASAAAAAAAKTVVHGAGQGAAAGQTQPAVNVPAATVANNNPAILQSTANAPATTDAVRGDSTFSTQIIIPTVVVPSAQLSVVPGPGQITSTLSDGSVVTISGVSVTLSSSVVIDHTLTGVQNATGSDGPQHPKTTLVGDSDIHGENIHTTTGLSHNAYIGIGVGFGILALLIILAAIWFRWYHLRQRRRNANQERSSSIDSLATKQGSGEKHGGGESKTLEEAQSDNSQTRTAELESPQHTSVSSFRSPVSPFSSISGQVSTPPNGSPTIYELIGSAPAEMVGSPASPSGGVEMQGSPTAEEVPGSTPNLGMDRPVSTTCPSPTAPVLEQGDIGNGSDDGDRRQRRFSFVKSLTADQFLSPKRGTKKRK